MREMNVIVGLNGVPYEGWEEFSVRRSIERMSGEFSLTFSELPQGWSDYPLHAPVSLEVNDRTLLSGWIDRVRPSYDGDGSYIQIFGRDAVGDLLDCAASIDGFEFNGQKLEQAIAKILKPFGIKLHVNTDTGAPIKRLAIQVGETAFDFIERACRLRSVIPLSDGVGGLVLTKPSSDRAAGRLVYGENILSGEAEIDWTERFSDYIVKGQNEAVGTFFEPEKVSEPEGRVKDQSIQRYRPTVILSESQGYDLSLQDRAKWQRSFNQARSKRITYTVQGFYADEQSLWLPNQVVNVVDPRLKLNRDMLIVGVEYSKTARGSLSVLELGLPEAFDLPAEKEEETTSDIWGDL